jgi:putative ABC transport system permease protein
VPTVFVYVNRTNNFVLKTKPGKSEDAVKYLESFWKDFAPNSIFSYEYLEDTIDYRYKNDRKAAEVIKFSAVISIILASFGLFGLVSFSVEQQVKNIGIRKTFGARVMQIVGLLTREFLVLVMIANLIGWAVSYFLIKNWLNNFAYHIEMNISYFLITGALVLIIVFLTISSQTIKAALANPVDSLRYE